MTTAQNIEQQKAEAEKARRRALRAAAAAQASYILSVRGS